MATLDTLVAHYHEIGLKGRNRNFFEDALTRNLRRALRGTGYRRLRRGFGRVVIDLQGNALPDEALLRASRVFGTAYVGLGIRVAPDMDSIAAAALDLIKTEPFESFRVRARRTHSSFEHSSNRINVDIGQRIVDETGGRVDLKHADATIWIEMFGNSGIVYRQRVEGRGGLPVGVSGRMLALMSGGIDSPVAAYRMARRGAEVELVHFHGQPFTDPSSVRQACELAEVLTNYQLKTTLHLVPLADAQREIVTNAPANLRVVLYRRTMMRIAASLAEEIGAQALVTGDSLGQVASQTIENIRTVDAATDGVQILRPLIGMDKQEIVNEATAIGTYEISTRRYQDCCVLFEPRSPATRTNAGLADNAESSLDMDALVGKALAQRETRVFELSDPVR
ncbi:MAG TPA: tRNA uracil 4-sulfurtransferase ThiI [Actinomycetota bacterium]|nr:tRNA uracil 4-sulfurtransferase ThiI [Actinomycetota bacterium]